MLQNKFLSLAVSALLIGCGSQNVADDYIKSGSGQTSSGDSTPEDTVANDETTQTGQDQGAESETESGSETTDDAGTDTETTTDTGDAAKGNEFLQNCKACHTTGGLASKVTLNAAAISRLDAAFTGANAGFHTVYSEAFQQPGRADLEAALKAIP